MTEPRSSNQPGGPNEQDRFSTDEVLIDLIIRYLDSELLPDETAQLESLLAGNAHNQAVFVDVCLQAKLCAETLGNRLHDAAADGPRLPSSGSIPIEAEPQTASSALLGFLRSTIDTIPGGEFVVGLLVMLAVVGATWGLMQLHAHLTGSDQQLIVKHDLGDNPFVATLTACENCNWGDLQQNIERASRLKAGTLDLRSGLAEVTFDSGARVLVEGPAVLALETAGRANLSIGRVVARVPQPAHGFTITSPSVTVVDLGTEFGLHVDAAGSAELHVFEGRVEAQPTAAAAKGRVVSLAVAGLARFDVEHGQSESPWEATTLSRHLDESPQRPAITLIEEGGRFAPGNLAQLKGAWAFGKNVLAGFAYHRIENLTDGLYGNEHSWISNGDGPSFAGVVLSGPCQIDSIAFGRDNSVGQNQGVSRERAPGRQQQPAAKPAVSSAGEPQSSAVAGFRDRWQGTYTVQYSVAVRTNEPPPEESWHTIDTIKYAPDMPEIVSEHIRPYLRHRFRFAPLRATAVRIVTSEPGTCIDELEVYGSRLTTEDK